MPCPTGTEPSAPRAYKVSIDVIDDGFFLTTFVITGANVNDNQVSIPLEQLTDRYVTSLHTPITDSKIKSFIRLQSKEHLTDPVKQRNSMPFAPNETLHFKARTTVKRTNGQMKLHYLPQIIHLRIQNVQIHRGNCDG
ncbi:hypothetical protein [uncultured Sphaerochaeta sp.]|uniref:hypothetical protein n=1 Tax=uncultured Sphaerochaeta sp. TaxID=886478 RepID=UPI002A0A24DF|nr:hypothetical protein [uncultured Sphaerochaeta sp.]